MKPFIYITIAVAAICNRSFAGSGNPPKIIFPTTFTASLKESGAFFEGEAAKICACQVLLVASKNQQEAIIAVFAQSSAKPGIPFNYGSALSVLENEKRHLKNFFFTKIKITENVTAGTACSVLYRNIQLKYANIKMYEVLDADALSDRNVTK